MWDLQKRPAWGSENMSLVTGWVVVVSSQLVLPTGRTRKRTTAWSSTINDRLVGRRSIKTLHDKQAKNMMGWLRWVQTLRWRHFHLRRCRPWLVVTLYSSSSTPLPITSFSSPTTNITADDTTCCLVVEGEEELIGKRSCWWCWWWRRSWWSVLLLLLGGLLCLSIWWMMSNDYWTVHVTTSHWRCASSGSVFVESSRANQSLSPLL